MIICDQCEREYHVGCLRSTGRCNLQAVPEGEWFCCAWCTAIHSAMNLLVAKGDHALAPPPPAQPAAAAAAESSAVSQEAGAPPPADPAAASNGDVTIVVSYPTHEYTWHLIRGKTPKTAKPLEQVMEILQESFDPIIDVTTQEDLLQRMVYAQPLGEFDFQGMFTILLRHRGAPVCAGLLRIFGEYMAELPLVATKLDARKRGHCRVFMDAVEALLLRLGVAVLSLPAASAAIPTWINHFAFRPMDLLDVQAVQSELRMLMFPGSQILYKTLGLQSKDGPFAFAAASAKACQAPPVPTRATVDNDVPLGTVEADLTAWLQERARLRASASNPAARQHGNGEDTLKRSGCEEPAGPTGDGSSA